MKALLFFFFVSLQIVALSQGHAEDLINADPQRMQSRILKLGTFGQNPAGGVSRSGFSEVDKQARQYIISLMRAMDLKISVDAGGNIMGRRAGQNNDLPFISFGSHIDSVPNGGNYDGQVGVISALEVIDLLNEHKIKTRHPLEVIVFVTEEDGLFGSKSMTGHMSASDLNFMTNSGRSVKAGIDFLGGDVAHLKKAERQTGEILAFIELHIEQGAFLDTAKTNIGVVEGIVGIGQWTMEVTGKANHAGTTSMQTRRDAMVAASRLIIAVNEAVKSMPGHQVGTVGEVEVSPNVSNIVPGKVTMSLEIRDLSAAKISAVFEKIQQRAKEIAAITNTKISIKHELEHLPALTDKRLQDIIEKAATELKLTSNRMPSGAGHDAQNMATRFPTGMIFVPSKDGISHSPYEYTSPQDMANGASVLLRSVLMIDKRKAL